MQPLWIEAKSRAGAASTYVLAALGCLLLIAATVGCGPSEREIEATVVASIRATETAVEGEATAVAFASIATTAAIAKESVPPPREIKKVQVETTTVQEARQNYLRDGCLGCSGILSEFEPSNQIIAMDFNGDGLKDAIVDTGHYYDEDKLAPFRHTGTTLELLKDVQWRDWGSEGIVRFPNLDGHIGQSDLYYLSPLIAFEVNQIGALVLVFNYAHRDQHFEYEELTVFSAESGRSWELGHWWHSNHSERKNIQYGRENIDFKYQIANIDDDHWLELMVIDLKRPVYVFEINDRQFDRDNQLEQAIATAIGDYISAANDNDEELAELMWRQHGPWVSTAAIAIAQGIDIREYHRSIYRDNVESEKPLGQTIIDSIDMAKIEGRMR